jgi:membrane-associated phospholipid phosphatase
MTTRSGLRPAGLLATVLALVLGSSTRGDERVSFASRNAQDLAITGASLALAGAIQLRMLEPEHCRWCAPGPLDVGARRLLVLPEGARSGASMASHVLALGLVPAALTQRIVAVDDRDAAAQDVLLMTEATSLAVVSYQLVKGMAARERPSVHYGDPDRPRAHGDDFSFWSGHTAFAFALAASAGTLASLHGERNAPWVWGVGMTVAAGEGYLRIASDEHYLTDVVAGAVLGTALGVLVPELRFAREREPARRAAASRERRIYVSFAF